MTRHRVGRLPNSVLHMPSPNLAAVKPEFGNRKTRVWQRPNPSVATAQLPSLAAAKPGFGNRQTDIWQLPNPRLATASLIFDSVL
jgi:hypothetical protein